MHGFEAKLNCLVFGERAAVLDTLQRFPPNLDQRHRLKQLAVTFVGPTLTKSFEQGRIDLDTCCLRHDKSLAGRTQSGHINRAIRDHDRSSPSSSNKLICWESLPSDDRACPPVPCSGLMKEILGKQMGL